MSESVLIVDDEESVRKTFQEWLLSSDLDVTVHAAPDAETALMIANTSPIDLAILDWNLGSGSHGLQLLEDLVEFQPDIVSILITGYAHRATPLDALRKGVRDYLDKNHDLTREIFIASIKRQLDRIIPAKRQKLLDHKLSIFREAIEKALPLVQASSSLNDPVPLPDAIRSLFRLLLRMTQAPDGALITYHTSQDKEEIHAYQADGSQYEIPVIPFARTLASSVISLQEACIMNTVDKASLGAVDLFPFESNRRSILAVPLRVSTGLHVVIELFDKEAFTSQDRQIVDSASDIGSELLRHALSQKHSHQLLFDTLDAAMKAADAVADVLTPIMPHASSRAEDPPPTLVMNQLLSGLSRDANSVVDADTGLQLVEGIRALAVRHGPLAVHYCVTMVKEVHQLLDKINR